MLFPENIRIEKVTTGKVAVGVLGRKLKVAIGILVKTL